MIFNDQKIAEKFKKEIQSLGVLSSGVKPLAPDRQALIKEKIFRSLLSSPQTAAKGFAQNWGKFTRYFAAVALGLSMLAGTAFASNTALPGQPLYSIKRAKEKVELTLTVSAESKAKLQAKFAQERLSELDELAAKDSAAAVPGALNSRGQAANGSPASPAAGLNTALSRDGQLRLRAIVEARAEVTVALSALKKQRDSLKAGGKAEEAASLDKNILQLQISAKKEHVIDVGQKGGDLGQSGNVPQN